MALGDVGFLTPAESAYYSPGAYDDVLRAESNKMATYLSQMDMFYENLSETQRQFDLTYELKQDALELEAERVEIDKGYLEDAQYKTKVWEDIETGKLSLENEELDFRKQAEGERLKFERDRFAEEAKFRREELAQRAESEKERLKLEQERLGLSKEELAARIDQIDKQTKMQEKELNSRIEMQQKELDQRSREIDEHYGLERDKMSQSHEEFMSNQDFNRWAQEQENTLNQNRLELETRGADLAEKQVEYNQKMGDLEFETKHGVAPDEWGAWPHQGGASDYYTKVAGAGTPQPRAITSDSTKEYAIDAEKEVGLEAIAAKKDIAEQAIEGGYDLAKLGSW